MHAKGGGPFMYVYTTLSRRPSFFRHLRRRYRWIGMPGGLCGYYLYRAEDATARCVKQAKGGEAVPPAGGPHGYAAGATHAGDGCRNLPWLCGWRRSVVTWLPEVGEMTRWGPNPLLDFYGGESLNPSDSDDDW